MEYERLEDPRVLVHPDYRERLVEAGLDTLDALLVVEGEEFKRNARRHVVRIEVGQGDSRRRLFVKAHPAPARQGWAKRLFGPAPLTAARQEWEHLLAMEVLGIGSMFPVALGEEPGVGPERRSVLVTEAIEEVERVEDYLPRRFGSGATSPEDVALKRRLIERLAHLARTFHGAGFFHKDFYLGHILLREESGELPLYLIDLQRTDRHPRPRRRWFVKDLAQMLYTTPSPPIDRTDLVRFFRLYRGVSRLGRDDRRFIGAILAKHRRMVRRVERKGPIRDW